MSSYLIKGNTLNKSSNNTNVTESKNSEDGQKILEPPFKFDLLIKVFETNFIANKSVDIFAKKVAYTGFDIVQDGEDEGDETLKDKITQAKKFLDKINPEKTFEDLIYSAATDFRITGNFAIEVVRAKIGDKITALYNIPITTARVLKGTKGKFRTGERFAQVYDSDYNDVLTYNKYYPDKTDRIEANGFNPDLNKEIETHEMIWGKNSNPGNLFYGYSPSCTVTRSYLIKKYIDDSHIQEFENSFLNRFAIIIEEGNLSESSINALQEYLAAIKQDQDWTAIPVIHNPSGRVRIEKLGESIRDGSYLQLLDKVNQEVTVAFGVPPILLGITENSTQANQSAQERKFYMEEAAPAKNMFAKIFTRMLVEDFGLTGIKLVPKTPDFKDRAVEIDIAMKGIEKGIYSINRAKALMGEAPLLDKDGNELEGAKESYIYIGGKPVPVKDLIQFTGDTATQINIEDLLAQANSAGDKLAKGIDVKKQIENSKLDY